jgi:hypothetical protein
MARGKKAFGISAIAGFLTARGDRRSLGFARDDTATLASLGMTVYRRVLYG